MATSLNLRYKNDSNIAETSPFAMRHLLIIFLILGFLTPLARAQNNDNSAFEVSDVVADVTADSAAHARDQAIAQAQRTAFSQLLERFDADAALGTKLSDDDIATLVQNFEVQNERASSVRYIGTFTVQFRPAAVRNYLGQHNASFDETPGKPVGVLPVLVTTGRAVLWEDKTRWRAAWENNAHGGGLVPVIVPAGELARCGRSSSTADAVNGKTEALKAMIERYRANGAVVATLDTDLDKPGQELKVTIDRYDFDGDALPGRASSPYRRLTDKAALDKAIIQAVKQVRQQLEKNWRKEEQTSAPSGDEPAPVIIDPQQQAASKAPSTHLPVLVTIQTLPQWATIKHKLESIPLVTHIDVITLARGSTNIEIEFHGSIDALETWL